MYLEMERSAVKGHLLDGNIFGQFFENQKGTIERPRPVMEHKFFFPEADLEDIVSQNHNLNS